MNSFDRNFGLRFSDRINLRFSFFLLSSFLLTLTIILYLNYYDFQSLSYENEKKIHQRYRQIISELIVSRLMPEALEIETEISINPEAVPVRVPSAGNKPAENRQAEREALLKEIEKVGILSAIKDLKYADLPEPGDFELSYEVESELPGDHINSRYHRRTRLNEQAGEVGQVHFTLDDDYFIREIERRGNLFISVENEEENKTVASAAGYRNQNEIDRVIEDHKPMINYCFQKGQRVQPGLRGYIKITFQISHDGVVLPESIRVISSTINNRKVVQCIKNTIKGWRNFEILDETMGIATVTQKFIFN